MHRVLLLCVLLALSLNAQTVKIVVQSPAVMKELQASGEIPPQVKLVTASGADLTREIADADGFVGGPLSAADLKAAKKLRWVQFPLPYTGTRRFSSTKKFSRNVSESWAGALSHADTELLRSACRLMTLRFRCVSRAL